MITQITHHYPRVILGRLQRPRDKSFFDVFVPVSDQRRANVRLSDGPKRSLRLPKGRLWDEEKIDKIHPKFNSKTFLKGTLARKMTACHLPRTLDLTVGIPRLLLLSFLSLRILMHSTYLYTCIDKYNKKKYIVKISLSVTLEPTNLMKQPMDVHLEPSKY